MYKRQIPVLLRAAAWACLAFIVFATVSPIGLRPHDVLPVNWDRALAFTAMSGLFTLAYPRRWLTVLVLTVGGAGFIELLQYVSPTRHAHLHDALVKAAGALAGVILASIVNLVAGRGAKRPGGVLRMSATDEAGITDALERAEAAHADIAIINLGPDRSRDG